MTDIEGPAFLAGNGDMHGRVRTHGWQATPLGAIASWPQSLRTVVGLMLQARQPMFLAWGRDLTLLYNDEYATVLGAKHPKALGQPFRLVWSDIWPQFGPLVQRVIAGEALSFEDLPITVRRNGYLEDTWFSFSYTPVRDESGGVAGLFCACTETTVQVLAGRRQAFRLGLEERLRDLADPREIMAVAAELLGQHLRVGRCGYGEADETGHSIIVEQAWTDGVMPDIVGSHRIADFGSDAAASYRAGHTIRVDDILADAGVERYGRSRLCRPWRHARQAHRAARQSRTVCGVLLCPSRNAASLDRGGAGAGPRCRRAHLGRG